MTTTVAPARIGSASAAMWGVALLLPVGPVAIGVLRLILPYYTAGDSAETVAAVQADAASQSAVLWLGYVGVLCLVPGLFVAARVCRDAAPRLTAWAMALAVPGYLSLGMFLGADHLLWSTSEAGISAADSTAVASAGHPSIDVALGVFVLGHVIGTVLLGLALLRSRRIPAWAAWVLAVSQLVHFAGVILGSPELDAGGWGLTALGMAMVARAVLREPLAD